MKTFKANQIPLQEMKNVRGGTIDVTTDIKVHLTKSQNAVAEKKDIAIEVSGTVTLES